MEPTPELYIEHTMQVLREIRRVLRADGLVWWNIGDTYNGSGGCHKPHHKNDSGFQGKLDPLKGGMAISAPGLKPKDLVMIPFRVALAAREDGWWVRSVVVWDKPNAMPESVKDRPTESHEYVILLARSERYFYDPDAVREPHDPATIERCRYRWANRSKYDAVSRDQVPSWVRTHESNNFAHPAGRNMRTVWRFPTAPYPGAHFAVFPPELPRRCVLAGTPPKVCATCGAPWERLTQREIDNTGYPNGPGGNYVAKGRPPGGQERDGSSTLGKVARYRVATVGWQPTCECHGAAKRTIAQCDSCGGSGRAACGLCLGSGELAEGLLAAARCPLCGGCGSDKGSLCEECDGAGEVERREYDARAVEAWPTRPAIVLDPFAGSGTALMIAEQLGRWWIGLEISAEYLPQIERRTAQRSLGLTE